MSIGAMALAQRRSASAWSSLSVNTGRGVKRSKNGTSLDSKKLVLLLLMLTILMYGVLALSGVEDRGTCIFVSLSTVDQPGGYALSVGVEPCVSIPQVG